MYQLREHVRNRRRPSRGTWIRNGGQRVLQLTTEKKQNKERRREIHYWTHINQQQNGGWRQTPTIDLRSRENAIGPCQISSMPATVCSVFSTPALGSLAKCGPPLFSHTGQSLGGLGGTEGLDLVTTTGDCIQYLRHHLYIHIVFEFLPYTLSAFPPKIASTPSCSIPNSANDSFTSSYQSPTADLALDSGDGDVPNMILWSPNASSAGPTEPEH